MTGYLVVTGLLFLAMGLRALFKPIDTVAVPYGLVADEVDARNYLRSGAGGVAIACGLVLMLAAIFDELALAALVTVVTVLGGLVAGRLFSLVADGKPGPTPWIAGAFEAVGLGFGVFWLVPLLRIAAPL